MPSFIIGNRSGGDPVVSGNPWSGQVGIAGQFPTGGVQLGLDKDASGCAYVALSGGVTVRSGGFFLSGGGLLDGVQVHPGGAYFIPRIATGPSGFINIFVACDAAASGQARLFYDVY